MNQSREFDIIIWGASGFTGRLVASYLFSKYGTSGNLRWAMAGRNLNKLEMVRHEVADETVSLVVADSNDEVSLKEMVKRTKVICTTVGPYAKYGSKLVVACIQNQVHYCDLAGEVQWMRQIIDQYNEAAKANETKIVHTCGFDSIPSDMGVYFIQREAKAKRDSRAQQIKMRVAGMSGGMSGGTYASFSNTMEEAKEDKNIFKVLTNPYGLNPIDEQVGEDKSDLRSIVFDKASQSWIGPFIMAGINTKVVRRSNILSGYSYGKNFRYEEATIYGKGFKGRMKDCRYVKQEDFGIFDAITCIGGLEHFCSVEEWQAGKQEQVYRDFFKTLFDLLPIGGRFYMQTMTFSKNMIEFEDMDVNAEKGSTAYIMALMLKQFPGSWLPYGPEMVIKCAEPGFKLISQSSGRLDYIETIAQWRKKFRKFHLKKYWLYFSLIPRYFTDMEFRHLVSIFKISPNKVCFEKEVMDHYRLVFEKL